MFETLTGSRRESYLSMEKVIPRRPDDLSCYWCELRKVKCSIFSSTGRCGSDDTGAVSVVWKLGMGFLYERYDVRDYWTIPRRVIVVFILTRLTRNHFVQFQLANALVHAGGLMQGRLHFDLIDTMNRPVRSSDETHTMVYEKRWSERSSPAMGSINLSAICLLLYWELESFFHQYEGKIGLFQAQGIHNCSIAHWKRYKLLNNHTSRFQLISFNGFSNGFLLLVLELFSSLDLLFQACHNKYSCRFRLNATHLTLALSMHRTQYFTKGSSNIFGSIYIFRSSQTW